MAEASREIDALVSRMDTTDSPAGTAGPLVDAAPTPPREVSSGVPGGTSVAAPPPATPPAAPPATSPAPHQAAPPQPAPQPAPRPLTPVAPVAQRVPNPYPRPQKPTRPVKPPMTTEEKIMRGVAIGGAAITIAGIILLVSVAIQRGWLGPLGRVLGAYLVGALLFGAAAWLRKRGTRVEGIIALMVTAQIAFVATTSALIFILEWWPPGLGSLVVLLGNAVFLVVAATWAGLGRKLGLGSGGERGVGLSDDRKGDSKGAKARAEARSVLLAVAIVTALVAWMFAASFDAWWPIAGIIVALLASYTVADNRIRLAMAIMATILQFMLISSSDALMLPAACVGIITPVLLVILTLWDPVKPREGDSSEIALAEYWRSFETDPVAAWVGVVLPVPIVACLSVPLIRLDAVWFTLLPAVLIAAIGVFAVLTDRPTQTDGLYASTTPVEYQRIARLIAVMGLALVAAVLVGIRYNGPPMEPGQFLDGALPVVVYLIAGSALFIWLRQLPRDRNLGVVPWVAWLWGAVLITGVLFRHVIVLAPVWLTDTSALIQAVLILGFIAATVLARESFYHRPLWLQLLVGATMLYLSATAIVTITTYLGNLIGGNTGMHLGFLIGHATVSILWMALAAVLMLHRSLLTEPGALWTGVGLAVAGTVKLVFFDLVALSGVPRAIAFLLSGLALLAIASLRGRRTGDAKRDDATPTPAETTTV